MKDIIGNRRRIGFARKLKLGWLVLRENGPIWTTYLGAYYVASSIAEAAFQRMHIRARRLGLPGTSSANLNREIWNTWDWQGKGDEWTLSTDWKDSLVRCILRKYIPSGKNVLEIGPGAGRWTEFLQPMSASLTGMDISQKCVDLCRQKFASAKNVKFLTTQGNNLAGVNDQSIEALWSFDVFVHIDSRDAEGYVREFRRVLRPGAIGVVHHSKAPAQGGWRSNLTAEKFKELLGAQGFTVVDQFESWQDGAKSMPIGRYQDVVTVFRY
jgi:ubiquinone/menaquinone biosynthesis C-methylase UbiE